LKIKWTPSALGDLAEIREFIRRDKPGAGKQQAEKIKKSVERLSKFPRSGKPLSSLPQVLEVVAGSYRIFYRIMPTQVEILRVYHGKRQFPSKL